MNTTIFGQSNVQSPASPTGFNGQGGYWKVPTDRTWYARTNADGSMQCAPNADFSTPVYDAFIDGDGSMVFWDTMANRMTGRA